MIASIRQLRSSTKQILGAVHRGDTVVITSRGQPYAKIVPFRRPVKKPESLSHPLFGIWKDSPKARSVKKYIDEVRKNRYAR